MRRRLDKFGPRQFVLSPFLGRQRIPTFRPQAKYEADDQRTDGNIRGYRRSLEDLLPSWVQLGNIELVSYSTGRTALITAGGWPFNLRDLWIQKTAWLYIMHPLLLPRPRHKIENVGIEPGILEC